MADIYIYILCIILYKRVQLNAMALKILSQVNEMHFVNAPADKHSNSRSILENIVHCLGACSTLTSFTASTLSCKDSKDIYIYVYIYIFIYIYFFFFFFGGGGGRVGGVDNFMFQFVSV